MEEASARIAGDGRHSCLNENGGNEELFEQRGLAGSIHGGGKRVFRLDFRSESLTLAVRRIHHRLTAGAHQRLLSRVPTGILR